MLEVRGLCARYGRAEVVHDVSLEVGAGEVVLLLGRNGAGKSTVLKALIGLVRPSAGSVRWEGREIAGSEPFRIARAGLGYVPEERRIFADLTVLENLEVGRRPAPPDALAWPPERLFTLFPALAELRHRRGLEMSGGEQQMLTVARTLMGNPRLLLLDEPSEGLAPIVARQMADAVRALPAEGIAVLLAEGNARFASSLGGRAVVLGSGRVAWSGPTEHLLADEASRRALLAV